MIVYPFNKTLTNMNSNCTVCGKATEDTSRCLSCTLKSIQGYIAERECMVCSKKCTSIMCLDCHKDNLKICPICKTFPFFVMEQGGYRGIIKHLACKMCESQLSVSCELCCEVGGNCVIVEKDGVVTIDETVKCPCKARASSAADDE